MDGFNVNIYLLLFDSILESKLADEVVYFSYVFKHKFVKVTFEINAQTYIVELVIPFVLFKNVIC